MCWCCWMTLCTRPLSNTSQKRFHVNVTSSFLYFTSRGFQRKPPLRSRRISAHPMDSAQWNLTECWDVLACLLFVDVSLPCHLTGAKKKKKKSKLYLLATDHLIVWWYGPQLFSRVILLEELASCEMMGRDCPLLVSFNYVIEEGHGSLSQHYYCIWIDE